ncbi:hypothetical protein [uncultured Clostridium sp.]|nr:hypothetical protein [uncultured Clostridium sp.]
MKIKLAILEKDREYLERVSSVFSQKLIHKLLEQALMIIII